MHKNEDRCNIDDPKTLFERWYSKAIAQLEKMENADGGTAGMMIVLPLYEGYIYILTATRPDIDIMNRRIHGIRPALF